ncbi:MAG: hypothetical protein MI863_22600, partial [Desulfobacterales bacterium]|nr:hypothetical protein [Desulfobacterales bacterium]
IKTKPATMTVIMQGPENRLIKNIIRSPDGYNIMRIVSQRLIRDNLPYQCVILNRKEKKLIKGGTMNEVVRTLTLR